MLLRQLEQELDASRSNASRHPFFSKFSGKKTSVQVQCFAAQWYRAARNHKKAFPFLIAITQDDETRRELIEILRDEYGNGEPDRVHAKLLSRFMTEGVGISADQIDSLEIIPEVAEFGDTTLRIWRDGDPVVAYGYHYALERIAASIHPVFFEGLRNCGFPSESLEYFRYHSRAEEEHVHATEAGLLRYEAEGGGEKLREGARLGAATLTKMWDGFDRHVFH
ncbi:MAG: iron-containing redox enzyme family protein [bacterium]|nr:iron-containing redox enzyme family protein [bacterium]